MNSEYLDEIYGNDVDFSDIIDIINMYKVQIDCHIFADIFTQLCEHTNAIEGLLVVLPEDVTLRELQLLPFDEKFDIDDIFLCYNYISVHEDESLPDFYRRFMRGRKRDLNIRTARCNILHEREEYTVFLKIQVPDSSSSIDLLEVMLGEHFLIGKCKFSSSGPMTCECGQRVYRDSLSMHLMSKQHINRLMHQHRRASRALKGLNNEQL